MRKTAIVFFVAFLIALSFSACSRNDSSKQETGSVFIGLAMPETHVQRWIKDGAALKMHAESRGYRAETAFANMDQELQNRQIRDFLKAGARLIVIGSINEGVLPAVAEAAKQKVDVIAYDRIISNSADYDYYITFNNYKVGQFQGQGLEDGLNLRNADAANPKYIALFAGSPTDGNAFFFYDGAMSVLNPYIKKGVLKVVGPYPETSKDKNGFMAIATENWQAPIAKARMEKLLKEDAKNITIDAVLAPNDTLARAIIEALKSDPKYGVGKWPLVSGQDAEVDSILAIKNGEQYMTIFKDTAKLAEAAVMLADEILKGNKNPVIPGAVLASGDLLSIGDTGRKVVKAFLLEPVFINNNNWHFPVQAGFFTPEEEIRLK